MQIHRDRLCKFQSIAIKHGYIISYERSLDQLYKFKGDDQADWNYSIYQYEILTIGEDSSPQSIKIGVISYSIGYRK